MISPPAIIAFECEFLIEPSTTANEPTMNAPDLAAELARAVFAEGDELAARHFPSAGPCRRLAFVHTGDEQRTETYNGGLCESALADRLRTALKFREILTAKPLSR